MSGLSSVVSWNSLLFRNVRSVNHIRSFIYNPQYRFFSTGKGKKDDDNDDLSEKGSNNSKSSDTPVLNRTDEDTTTTVKRKLTRNQRRTISRQKKRDASVLDSEISDDIISKLPNNLKKSSKTSLSDDSDSVDYGGITIDIEGDVNEVFSDMEDEDFHLPNKRHQSILYGNDDDAVAPPVKNKKKLDKTLRRLLDDEGVSLDVVKSKHGSENKNKKEEKEKKEDSLKKTKSDKKSQKPSKAKKDDDLEDVSDNIEIVHEGSDSLEKAVGTLTNRLKNIRNRNRGSKSSKKQLEDIVDQLTDDILPKGLVPHGSNAPKLSSVAVIPTYSRPLFPGLYYPCVIRDEKLIEQILASSKKGLPYVGVFLTKTATPDTFVRAKTTIQPVDKNNPSINADVYDDMALSASDLHNVGCFAQIYKMNKVDGGGLMLILVGLRRIQTLAERQKDPFLVLDVKHIDEPSRFNSQEAFGEMTPEKESQLTAEKMEVRAITMEIMSTLKEIVKGSHVFSEQLSFLISNIDWSSPGTLADICATITTLDNADVQKVLETFNVNERLRLALDLLKKEADLLKVQQDIHKKVEESLSANQRKYLLTEQLKNIKKELGIQRDEKEELKNKYTKLIEGKTLPPDVQKVWDDEMMKLQTLEPAAMEFNVTRNYLDWLGSLPWGITSKEYYDIPKSELILNEDHYGLEDVKDKIVEFIAISKLRNSSQGKIILLVGPPGVGKTSIGKSVAKALDREFYRFSVGGMHDSHEIKGHRRTYVGAMPGKIIQALKKTQVQNPVVLIDEIDKLGKSHSGDPASALLEVLDPEQNNTFLDHYLDVNVDLSKVLFVCTANTTDTIPGPLLDRMTVIRISGYVEQEKLHIAKHYLCPNVSEKFGINNVGHSSNAPVSKSNVSGKNVIFTNSALMKLIKWYCRESGVRNLNKYIEQIYSKIAVEIVKGASLPIVVTDTNLHRYVGQETYRSERMYTRCPVGVVMGLAWSTSGGSVLYLESVLANSVQHKSTNSNTNNNLLESPTQSTTSVNSDGMNVGSVMTNTPASFSYSFTNCGNKDNKSEGKGDNDNPGSGQLKLTGQMGDVMKESMSIAYTLSKIYLGRLAKEQELYSNTESNTNTNTHVPVDLPNSFKHPTVATDNITYSPASSSTILFDAYNTTYTSDITITTPASSRVPSPSPTAIHPPLWCVQPELHSSNQNTGVYSKYSNTNVIANYNTDIKVNKNDISFADIVKTTLSSSSMVKAPLLPLYSYTKNLDKLASNTTPPNVSSLQPPPNTLYPSISTSLTPEYLPVPDPAFFSTNDLHLHIPQGAVPKDGPSAGAAIVSCLLSTALNRPLVPDIAMTGEVCLTGKVLPIGGLKEKIIAAKRSNVKTVICPIANSKDIAEIPNYILSGMTIYLVDTVEEVIRIVFGVPWALNGDKCVTQVRVYEEEDESQENREAYLHDLEAQQQAGSTF